MLAIEARCGGAVAIAAAEPPSRPTCGEIECGERSGDGDDYDIVDDERRTRESPDRYIDAGRGRRFYGPHHASVCRIERVKDARGAKAVDAAVAELGLGVARGPAPPLVS